MPKKIKTAIFKRLILMQLLVAMSFGLVLKTKTVNVP